MNENHFIQLKESKSKVVYYIKSIEEREYLFDLDAGARSLLSKHGRSDDLDLIFKSYSNLLRVMGD